MSASGWPGAADHNRSVMLPTAQRTPPAKGPLAELHIASDSGKKHGSARAASMAPPRSVATLCIPFRLSAKKIGAAVYHRAGVGMLGIGDMPGIGDIDGMPGLEGIEAMQGMFFISSFMVFILASMDVQQSFVAGRHPAGANSKNRPAATTKMPTAIPVTAKVG